MKDPKSTKFTDKELREAFVEANSDYDFEVAQASYSYLRLKHINRTALNAGLTSAALRRKPSKLEIVIDILSITITV